MMTVTRGLAAGVVLAGAAVGLAGPASAEPLSGTYSATFNSSSGEMQTRAGDTLTFVLTPCGPDCTHLANPSEPSTDKDLHLLGSLWTAVMEILQHSMMSGS
jgi:hypothetical protein